MRTIKYADEVWTPNGIVDSIRFEDYIVSRHEECELINYRHIEKARANMCKKMGNTLGECKLGGTDFPRKDCTGCFHLSRGIPVMGTCITAYEIKITKSDFKSENGHNIDDINSPIANENYYCVPKELVKDIESMVPNHCGILVWNGYNLRKHKDALWIDVPEQTQIMLLYNAMKKWVDAYDGLSLEA